MMHRSDVIHLMLLQPLRHCTLHLGAILVRVSSLPTDNLEQVVFLVPDVVL